MNYKEREYLGEYTYFIKILYKFQVFGIYFFFFNFNFI